jgi:hypothetical protein
MKDFKGLVKISDVQNAFDEIVSNINDMVDTYNASAKVLDIDYTKGSAELGASGYTLSVGGLKRIIQTYQGCSVGCKPFKIDANHCKVTAGFVFADNTVYRANEQDMTGSGNILYFDVDNKRYSFGAGATTSVQSVTIPKITNSTSWGNIWATSDSSVAWQVPSMIPSGTTGVYKGWTASAKLEGYGKQWQWVWNFPSASSGHVKFGAIDAFGIEPFSMGTLSGSLSNFKTSRDSNNNLWCEFDFANANGIRIYGTFNKRGAYVEPFYSFFGMQLTDVKTTIITDGDADAGRLVKICDLNWNRDTRQLATINKVMSESSNRSITIQGRGLPFVSNNGFTGGGAFCWATDGQYDGEVKLFGNQISYMQNRGGSSLRYFTIPTYLYIPKGVANPLTGKLMNTYTAKYKD